MNSNMIIFKNYSCTLENGMKPMHISIALWPVVHGLPL